MFSLGLEYESSATGGVAQYNGNIATLQWNTYINATCGTRQLYRFGYDAANRLLTADHRTWSGSAWTDPNRYNESGISYDLNGNIKGYTRRGLTTAPSTFGAIDQLTYYYDEAARPDRLTRVMDAGVAAKGFVYNASATTPHYVYDANGNLVQDKHKDLFINYNPYNLPNSINNPADSYITITYTADGEKLTKVAGGATRNYVAGIEYLGANLDAIYHAEGRCTPNGATAFYYEYALKDHLGNVRVNFRANGTAVTFLEEMHYYPFGMLMEGISTAAVTVNAYKYNGKEINTDLGLNWSDYGARWYDPVVGRWGSIDLLSTTTPYLSPFTYSYNNPIKFLDPNGMSAVSADDLTNEQWLEVSRSSNTDKASAYKFHNRLENLYKNKNEEKRKALLGVVENALNDNENANTHIIISENSILAVSGRLEESSFNFESVTSNWQEAIVTSLRLSITDFGGPHRTPRHNIIEFNIEIGVPKRLSNGQYITRNRAAEKSCYSANLAALYVGSDAGSAVEREKWFAVNHEVYIPNKFAQYMSFVMTSDRDGEGLFWGLFDLEPPAIPGTRVRVVTNNYRGNVRPKKAIYNGEWHTDR